MADGHIAALHHNQGAPQERDPLLCDVCQNAAIAVSPGTSEVRNRFLLRRPVPRRQWCLACWPASLPARVLP